MRREKLIDLLDINLQWRMHKVSDGQKRRVQICMGLLHPFKVKMNIVSKNLISHVRSKLYSHMAFIRRVHSFWFCCHVIISDLNANLIIQVLLLDEVTVDLDVVARMDLLEFFKEECDQV